MQNLHRILAAVDFGEPDPPVLDVAATVASRVGASVAALHAYQVRVLAAPDVAWVAPPEDAQRVIEGARGAMDDLARSARERHPGVSIDTVVVEGDASHAIVDAIASQRPDLVVQGTHGRGFWARALLGSVARHVIRHSPVPVLTVKAGPLANLFAAGGPSTVLVPTDFTADSDRVLDFALELAVRLDASVRLLSCYPDPQPIAIYRSLDWALDVERRVRLRLDEVIASRQDRGVEMVPATSCGSPARGIVEEAERSGAGLVVMATHVKGLVDRVFTGSVALDVVRHSPVSVITWSGSG